MPLFKKSPLPVGGKYWQWHRNAYGLIALILLIVNALTSGSWWSFWPLLGWGIFVLFHFFLVRSLNVDDEWVANRTGNLRDKSYDLGHINDIQAGYFPIVDAHHHLWDLDKNYHPWLCDEPLIKSRHGDYSSLRRNYLPKDFRRDTSGFQVVGSVYVETEWDPRDPVSETRWVQGIIDATRLCMVVVARAELDGENVREILAQQAQFPCVRGIRHKPKTLPEPAQLAWGTPGSMSDKRWLDGYAQLSEFNLSFDLQIPYWHLPEALELAKAFPDTLLVLNHTGLPNHRVPQALKFWRTGLEKLAELPNTAIKISGLGEPHLQPWRIEKHERVIIDAIERFGVDRSMFASNYPVESLYVDYGIMMRGYFTAVRDYSIADKEKLFLTNAARLYRMEIPEMEEVNRARRFGTSPLENKNPASMPS